MSYARWSKESDVYVYADVAGHLRCCGCNLGFLTTREMIDHLGAHRAAGQMVPESCIIGLLADADENDAWMAGLGEES